MGDEAAPQGMWCKVCKEPVTLTGAADLPQEMRAAVHVATGTEAGPGPGDGTHLAVPTPQDPVFREQADRIERDFPPLKLSVRLGYFWATWRPDAVRPAGAAPFYTARDEQEMRERLHAVLAGQAVPTS